MGVNEILEIGRQGLMVNRQAIQTTANNITNANTPGYSRQRPVLAARDQESTAGTRIGGGVELKSIIRVHDSFVEKRLLEETRPLGDLKARMEGLKRAEGVLFNGGNHLGEQINRFFNDYRELSLNPEVSTIRGSIASSAESIGAGFRKMSESLENQRKDVDYELSETVKQININTKELAKLNGTIYQLETLGDNPNELLDRRDDVVRQLSQKMGTQGVTDDQGQVNLIAPGLGILVQGVDSNDLYVMHTPENGNKSSGSLDIFLRDSTSGQQHQVTQAVKEGEMGGLLYTRDNVINPTLKFLDNVAYQFSSAVNEIHREGVGMDGVGGRDLFHLLDKVDGAASQLALSNEIKASHENVAAGLQSDGPGDNRIALKMTELQSLRFLPGAGVPGQQTDTRYTVNDTLNGMLANVASQTQTHETLYKHQEGVVEQLDNYKQSISGVNLEEEGINLIQYQTSFNAAAKTMKVADELLQTILRLKD